MLQLPKRRSAFHQLLLKRRQKFSTRPEERKGLDAIKGAEQGEQIIKHSLPLLLLVWREGLTSDDHGVTSMSKLIICASEHFTVALILEESESWSCELATVEAMIASDG